MCAEKNQLIRHMAENRYLDLERRMKALQFDTRWAADEKEIITRYLQLEQQQVHGLMSSAEIKNMMP